ncbi:SGNH/GDSL hydrolase family protein [Salinarimonas chemoclinalis]|uniref:SGNH/GDSL hydrolase family protein n=1 Tax=Salinarimonas chemoclinalis TaxID=3241599 RepID=UPI003557F9CD
MRAPRPLVRLALACAALVLAIAAGTAPVRANDDERRIWLEVLRSQPTAAEPAPAARQRPRRAPRPARAPVSPPQAETAAAVTQDVPQDVPITHRVVVFGDSLASNLGEGLADVLSDKPNVTVQTRAQGSSGLVRDDFHDWRAEIDPFLTGEGAFDIGVVLVGLNDRQDIATPERRLARLGPEWKEAYARRVDAILAKFRAAGVPLVWVGLPPMRSSRLSTDLQAINEIVRGRVTRGGGIWVDIWQGFVDDDNRYSDNGPTLEGQIGRLRAGDGIHLTPAGGRKAAHFADVEIRRLLARDRPAPVSAVAPPPAADGLAALGDLEALTVDEIVARLSALPEAPDAVAIEEPPPAIGPVVPLTETAAAGGSAALVRAPPLADRATRLLNERVLADGVAPPAAPGRADDFTWPAAPASR